MSREEIKDESKFIANEFVVHYKEQILPIYGISIMRCEYLIIWRDYNFDETNPNNYEKEVFKKMIKFNEEIKKFSYREVDSKVYYVKTSEEGLNLIRRKKYNKIILQMGIMMQKNILMIQGKLLDVISCISFGL